MSNADSVDDEVAPLRAAADRQAVSTLRGYAYQIWRTLLAWFSLEPNETLFIEGAEDYDVLRDKEGRTVQVKDLARNVTLASPDILESILHYWEHRRNNPERTTHFHLVTTAGRGKERPNPFDEMAGLDYWDACRRAGTDLGPLREFLPHRVWPVTGQGSSRQLREELTQEFRTFITTASDDDLREQLIRRVHWHTGSDIQEELERRVEDAVITHGAQFLHLAPTEAKRAIPQLLKYVWGVAVQQGDRRLTYADLHRQVEEATMVLVSRAKAELIDRLAAAPDHTPLAVPLGALPMVTAENPDVAASDAEQRLLARLAEARELHLAGQVRTALRLLERLREDALAAGSPASPRTRARIFNNIGAALIDLMQFDEAVVSFATALDYAEGDAAQLANLAQAELLAGRKEAALRHAEEAIAVEPGSRVAWSVRIQSSRAPVLDEAIPAEVRRDPAVIAARAMVIRHQDRGAAVDLLRDALRAGPRDPQLLVLLSEMLYSSVFALWAAEAVPEDAARDIARLAEEAAAALVNTENQRLLSRALVAQGAAVDLLRTGDRGAALFGQAVTADPTYVRARFAAARAQWVLGNGPAALFLLNSIDESERTAEWHALRASTLLMVDQVDDVEREIRAALGKLSDGTPDVVIANLGETLLRSGHLGYVEEVFALLEKRGQFDALHLFRARAADLQDNTDAAAREYEAALVAATPAMRREVQIELAYHLYRHEQYEHAAELFEESRVWELGTRQAQVFARTLLSLGAWDKIEVLTQRRRERGEADAWVVDLEARLATRHNDVPRELAMLERLVQLAPGEVDAQMRLAQTLIRAGRTTEAAEILEPLEERRDLEFNELVDLALMLVAVDRHQPALELAYHVLRNSPDNADLLVACIHGVFFHAAAHAPEEMFTRTSVIADTWVKLQADDGEVVEYTLFAEGPHDIRHNEFLAADIRAEPLLGLHEGQRVTWRRGAANEKEFHVAELKSALLHTFHDAMIQFQVRFPGRTDLQMVHVGEGESFDPTPFDTLIIRASQAGQELLELYRANRVPVALLANVQGETLRRAYIRLLYNDNLPVYVEEPQQLEASLHEARKPAVVVTATGVATLQELGCLGLLRRMYERVLIPQSLVDEWNAEITHWDEAIRHGGFGSAGAAADHSISYRDVSPEMIGIIRQTAVELRDTLLEIGEVVARPVAPRDAHEDEAREKLGASSYDAYTVGGDEVGMLADDWGLRNLSR